MEQAGIAPVFNLVTNEVSLQQVVQGALDAALISLLVGGYLLFIRDGAARGWFRWGGSSSPLRSLTFGSRPGIPPRQRRPRRR